MSIFKMADVEMQCYLVQCYYVNKICWSQEVIIPAKKMNYNEHVGESVKLHF